METPVFKARQADLPESLEFPIRANHATKDVMYVILSALGKWGRTQMGSDGLNRILTGFYFFDPAGVRLVPLKTRDFKGSHQILTGF